MKTKIVLVLATIATLLLAGCQNGQTPERPLNTGDRPRVGEETIAPEDEILPILNVNVNGESHEMKLRSQTSRFIDNDKKEMEITLSSSRIAFCEDETPALEAGEEQLIITVKSPEAIAAGDALSNEVSAIFKTSEEEKEIKKEEFKKLTITDVNAAIARGSLDIATEELGISGEFFTAICN